MNMEVKIIKSEKNNIVVELSNKTIAELLRVYLNNDSSVELAAWKRDSPGKPAVLEVKTKGKDAKKAIEDAVKAIEKETTKYLDEFKPLVYLFEGHEAGKKVSTRIVQKVVINSANETNAKKQASAHSLRHSFATHLLEQGVNLRYIQELLGHARLETTQIYTKVATNKFNEINDLLEYE